jgi:eukaryotic-like serine/threonine-protein kinase
VPTALVLRRAGPLWSAPAGAPLLGAAGLAAAWPALAGQAARPWHRLALGALGFWWLALAELETGARLGLGPPPGAGDPGAGALATVVTSGALALAAVWALAALVLPAFVRGRRLAVDLVGATVWAAATGSATEALAGALTWGGGSPALRGLVAGTVLAAAAAVLVRAPRSEAGRGSGP